MHVFQMTLKLESYLKEENNQQQKENANRK